VPGQFLPRRSPVHMLHAGKKQQVGWTRHYLIAVTQSLTSAVSSTTHSLQAYDLRNKLIATSLPLREVQDPPPPLTIHAPPFFFPFGQAEGFAFRF